MTRRIAILASCAAFALAGCGSSSKPAETPVPSKNYKQVQAAIRGEIVSNCVNNGHTAAKCGCAVDRVIRDLPPRQPLNSERFAAAEAKALLAC
jgi:hypothetical protein